MSERNKLSRGRGQKLIYFLERLEPAEREDFQHYLASPLLGNSLQFVAWLEVIERKWERIKSDGLQAEMFYGTLRKQGKEVADRYIWVRLTHLQQRLFDYIAFLAFQQDPSRKQLALLREVVRRGGYKHFPRLYKSTEQALAKAAGAHSLRDQMDLEFIHGDFLVENAQVGMGAESGLGRTLEALESFYVVQKLKIACAEYNHRIFAGPTTQLEQIQATLAIADQLKKVPLVRAYASAFRLLESVLEHKNGAEAHFFSLKESFFSTDTISARDARDLFAIAQNFAVLRYHNGAHAFLSELTLLYERMLEIGAFLEKDLLDPVFFKNTVMLMCRIGNVDWAAEFVQRFQGRIANDPQALMGTYNQAVVRFFQGNFQGVIELLYDVIPRFQQVAVGIGARVYFCRALWMQAEYEWLLNALKGFEQFLSRNKEVEKQDQERYRGYVRIFRKMALAAEEMGKSRVGKLEALAEEVAALGRQELYGWLWARIRELLEREPSYRKKRQDDGF